MHAYKNDTQVYYSTLSLFSESPNAKCESLSDKKVRVSQRSFKHHLNSENSSAGDIATNGYSTSDIATKNEKISAGETSPEKSENVPFLASKFKFGVKKSNQAAPSQTPGI